MIRVRIVSLVTALGVALLGAPVVRAPLAAQESSGGQGGRQGAPPDMRRRQLEQQLRQNVWRIARERIGLTDQQMQRLGETTRKFDVRRRALFQEERAQRETLRTEILADARADQARIAAALDRLTQLQRQRIDLQAEEQRELSTFMTPIQRAKFATLQEQLRRRAEAIARERRDSMRAGGALGPR